MAILISPFPGRGPRGSPAQMRSNDETAAHPRYMMQTITEKKQIPFLGWINRFKKELYVCIYILYNVCNMIIYNIHTGIFTLWPLVIENGVLKNRWFVDNLAIERSDFPPSQLRLIHHQSWKLDLFSDKSF